MINIGGDPIERHKTFYFVCQMPVESRGVMLKGARGLTFGQTRNGSEEGGSARVRERLEAHGGPRDREYVEAVCNKCLGWL